MKASSAVSEDDVFVYYGNRDTTLYKVTGEFRPYDPAAVIFDPYNKATAAKALELKKDISSISKAYANNFVPCPPCTAIYLPPAPASSVPVSAPKSLLVPLLKLEPEKDALPIPGITSGHRSVILPGDDGLFYRLKGCGNDLLGFVVRQTNEYPITFGIRGSQFDSTCVREQYFAHAIDKVLIPYKMRAANFPIGYWRYGKELKTIIPKKQQPANEVPEMDKFCGLFITSGERRLGTHLLSGLQQILRAIVHIAIEEGKANEETLKNVLSLFPKERISKEGDSVIPTYVKVRNFDAPYKEGTKEQITLEEWCKKPIYTPADFANIATLEKVVLPSTTAGMAGPLAKLHEAILKVDKWGTLLMPKLIPQSKGIFVKRIPILMKALPEKPIAPLANLALLCARIGYEAGTVKRALQDGFINWGTYIDHNPFEIHCNAHCNNFVIQPPGKGNLLAPLDFDMSYDRPHFINIIEERKDFGEQSFDIYECYTNMERQELEKGLGGSENMNFDYSAEKKEAVASLETKLRDAFEYLLRDVMVECYRKAFDKIPVPEIVSTAVDNEAVRQIIAMCLLTTVRDIA